MTDVRPEAVFIKEGTQAALLDSLSFDENGKLETTAMLEANTVDVTVGDVDLTGDSLAALQSVDTKTYAKKGTVTIAHNAITVTTTSTTISTVGYNAVLISTLITGTGTWNVKLQGKFTEDGTFMDMYDNNGNLLSYGNLSTSAIRLFTSVPDYIQIVATEITDGATLTVEVQPINV